MQTQISLSISDGEHRTQTRARVMAVPTSGMRKGFLSLFS